MLFLFVLLQIYHIYKKDNTIMAMNINFESNR